MPEIVAENKFSFLRSKPVLAVTIILLAQIAFFYMYPTSEYEPTPPLLTTFTRNVGPWTTEKESKLDDETQKLLKSDDSLSRVYGGPAAVDFFVGFFKSQRGGVTPHSPQVCLPGNGWTPERLDRIRVNVPGVSRSVEVNRFIVNRGDQRKLMLYWYQNAHRDIASEYMAKVYLIWDSLRYHRSDEAMVRVMVDIHDQDETAAQQTAIQFLQLVYVPLKRQMWTYPTGAVATALPQ